MQAKISIPGVLSDDLPEAPEFGFSGRIGMRPVTGVGNELGWHPVVEFGVQPLILRPRAPRALSADLDGVDSPIADGAARRPTKPVQRRLSPAELDAELPHSGTVVRWTISLGSSESTALRWPTILNASELPGG